MGDKIQPRGAVQSDRRQDSPYSRISVQKKVEVVEVEWGGLPDKRLEEFADEVRRELGLVVPPQELGLVPSQKVEAKPPTQITPPAANTPASQPQRPSSFGILAFLLLVMLLLGGLATALVFKGFDTLLAAAQTHEGAAGVSVAMVGLLKGLAPFIKVVFGGTILSGASFLAYRIFKIFKDYSSRG